MGVADWGFIALDGMKVSTALSLARSLEGKVLGFKVNDALFAEMAADQLIPKLAQYGRVFADPKLHDIPKTVYNSAKRLAVAGAHLLTVHAQDGPDIVKAAVEGFGEAAEDQAYGVLAVTLLTSISNEQCKKSHGCEPKTAVRRFATFAREGGAWGLVCSPQEVRDMQRFGLPCVVPGVRSPGAEHHEQARVDTPKHTIAAGARFLVIGREVTESKNPMRALENLDRLSA